LNIKCIGNSLVKSIKTNSLPIVLLFLCTALKAQDLNPELVFKSFQRAFPEKINEVSFINDDWTIKIGEEIFYWARGRLLPASLKDNWESYRAHGFFRYPDNIPEIQNSPREYTMRTGNREIVNSNAVPYYGFQSALYGGMTKREVETQQVRVTFLGKTIVINKLIRETVKRIEEKILTMAKTEAEVAEFISEIDTIGAYNWRTILGSNRMSYHSWGIAIDIQPKQLGKKAIYWAWERLRNDNWQNVPLGDRWMPPLSVVKVFEEEGFIWGGKWRNYDNMHFEYRPELHILKLLLEEEERKEKARNTIVVHHIYPENINIKTRQQSLNTLRAAIRNR